MRYALIIFLAFSPVTGLFSQTDSISKEQPQIVVGDSTKVARTDTNKLPFVAYLDTGIASWYGPNWEGRLTASGELFSPDSMTAAHKWLPFGTVVKVTNLSNDSVVYVRITDRLPKSSTRSIDLTPVAAKRLGFFSKGLQKVRMESVGKTRVVKKKLSLSGRK